MNNNFITNILTNVLKISCTQVIFICCLINSYSQWTGENQNLSAYWKFDEGTGIITNNEVSDIHGTLINNVQWADDQFGGKAVLLNGDSSYISFGTTTFGIANDFTIGFWIKILGDAGTYIESIMQMGGYGHPFTVDIEGNNKLRSMIRTDSGTNYYYPQKSIATNEWLYVGITCKDSIRTIYFDGRPVGGDTLLPGHLVFMNKIFTIGNAVQPFYGLLDEVRIYNRALNDDEIYSLLNKVPFLPDTINPTTPEKLIAVAIPGNKARLSWNPSADDKKLIGYHVYRNNTIILSTSETEITDSLLVPETTYIYYVTAYDKSNNESEKSNTEQVTNPSEGYLFPPDAILKVEPGLNVEVGEPVLFDATGSTDDQYLIARVINGPQGIFEYDFGDGYSMKISNRNTPNGGSGISVLHYFMRPGDFTTTLYVTDIDGHTDSAKVTIHVTGIAPMEGFELLHAPFNNRLAQYIYARIPEPLRANNDFKLQMALSSEEGYNTVLYEKSNLMAEEKLLLNNSLLPAGNYLFTAKILNLSDDTVTLIREKFYKPYDGIPYCGFDENNTIHIKGEKIFPIMPWLFNTEKFNAWANKYINTLCGVGYYPAQNISSWLDYLNKAKDYNLKVIGPTAWEGAAPMNRFRNSDINKVVEYTEASKDHESLMMYQWADEPNLGGYENKIPAQVYASWTYKCRQLDQQHPSWVGMYGFDYLKNYETWNDEYNYMHNARFFGGKKHFAYDAAGADIYPVEFGQTGRMAIIDSTRGPIDLWVESIDNQIIRNYNLVPIFQTIETQDVLLESGHNGITAAQVKMENWLSVVHNVKGLLYFQYFGVTPTENFKVMEEFYTQINDLKDIILDPSSDRKVTDNANTRSNRVDFTVRENDTAIFIFSARLTEPEYEWAQYPEPEKIIVNFNIDGIDHSTVSVLYENRVISIKNGILTDTFPRNAVHLYLIRKNFIDTTKPAIPQNLSAEIISGHQINLSWDISDDLTGISGYILFRNNIGIDTVSNNFYSDNGLKGCTMYSYKVLAIDSSGNLSDYSDSINTITSDQEAPTVPSDLKAKVENSLETILTWSKSSDECSDVEYKIFRNDIFIDKTADTNYSDLNLPENTTYSYKISSVDKSGNESGLSDAVSVKTENIPDNIPFIDLNPYLKVYPNPFSNKIHFRFYNPVSHEISIEIFDIYGRKIENIYKGFLSTGNHIFTWNVGNKNKILPGMYYCIYLVNNVELYRTKIVKQ